LETYAAVDIGSNAIRTLILKKDDNGVLTIVKKDRAPVRLGSDVFNIGFISEEKRYKIIETFVKINDLLVKYQVTKTRACATSAMREAQNGKLIIEQIKQNTGISIELIDGDTEAKLIHNAVQSELHLDKRLSVLIDIGGGSTEFTISENELLISCKSFPIGAVRLLKYPNFFELSNAINAQLLEAQQYITSIIGNRKVEAMVGTGGNFRRLGKINRKISGKTFTNFMNIDEVENVFGELNKLSHDERVKKFDLSDDRADVIIPAALLIKSIAHMLEVKGIYIPKVGLKEGIALSITNIPL
jgi:exopolyphosphatase/guanosine-5'-triphosphate,3'-diphosphate pyrophosphatase